MSGSKEPGGPTYVTDGLTSGALGPSPEHRGRELPMWECGGRRE
jgi:hypothetical protein